MSSKKCLTRVSSKSVAEEVSSECFTRVSSKKCQVRVSSKNVLQECQGSECLVRVSSKRVSCKSFK